MDEISAPRWPVPFTDAVRELLHSTRAPLLRSHPSGDMRMPGCEYRCRWRPGEPYPTLLRCGAPGGHSRWAVWYDLEDEVWCWGVGPGTTPHTMSWFDLLTCQEDIEAIVDDNPNVLPPLGRAWRTEGDFFYAEDLGDSPSKMHFSVIEESVVMTHWWTPKLHVKMPAEVRRAVEAIFLCSNRVRSLDQTTLPVEMWCAVLNCLRGGSMLASRPAPTSDAVEECWPAGAIRAPQDFSVVDAAHAVPGAPVADQGDVVINVSDGRSLSLPVATQLESLAGHVTQAPNFAFPDGVTALDQCMLLLVSPAEALQVEYTEWVWGYQEAELDAVGFNRDHDGAELEVGASRNRDGFFGNGGPPQQPSWWYLHHDAPFLPLEYTVLGDDPCPTQWYRLAIPISLWGRSLADCRIPNGAAVSLVPAAQVLNTAVVKIQPGDGDADFPAKTFQISVTNDAKSSLSEVMWWYAHRAQLPYQHYVYCDQRYNMQKSDPLPEVLSIRQNIKVDIGVLGEYPGAIGAEFLRQGQHENATTADAIKIADSLNATLGASFSRFPDVLPSETSRRDLMSLADSRHRTETDFKLTLTLQAVESVLGKPVLAAALRLFNSRVDEVIVRRVEPTGTSEIIAFHTDHAAKTMQIPLNDEDDYDGGRITFVTQNGLIQPRRVPGSAIIHDYRIPHGVTAQTAGIRYGLFFLTHFRQTS